MAAPDISQAIDAVWRIESAALIAGLTRIVRDVAVAEDLAQDALVAALEGWPTSGIPEKPGAWLMATAKHRAIDHLRRNKLLDRKREEIAARVEPAAPEPEEGEIGDNLLRLMFMTCHPVLAAEARVALTLRLLGGYWMIQVKSKAEAVEWASRAPMGENEIIEVRQVQEYADFPPETQKHLEGFPEMQNSQKK